MIRSKREYLFFGFHQFLRFCVLVILLDPKDITAHDFCLECTMSHVDFSTYHLSGIFVYVCEFVLILTDRLLIVRHFSVRTLLKLLDSTRHPMILLHSNFSFEFTHNSTQPSFLHLNPSIMKIASKSSASPKKRSTGKSAASSTTSSNSICPSSSKKIKLASKITPDTTLTKTSAKTPRTPAKRKKVEDDDETKKKVIRLDQDEGKEEIEELEDKKLQRTLFDSCESSDSENDSSMIPRKSSPKDWKDLDYTTLSDFVEVNRTQSKKALSRKDITKLVSMPLEGAVRKCMDGCKNVVWTFIFNKIARFNNVEEEPDLMQKPKVGKDMFVELALLQLSPSKKGSDDEEEEDDDDESDDEQW